MTKVKVAIEEHLCKEVEIEVPDSVVASDDVEAVLKKAIEMYENEEIVLTADDFNGIRLIAITDDTVTNTEWDEF